ncbi:bifunctional [glutamine synthetase] adenylyltransferase/[glutamine synthetase]-adenylyl-L-tyrosine phosphorylase [Pikeienuella sp. HZG-20]|uniref:bifunctional [glutamine synthetase] adenylyltransferase/[glutamine synthetase]-adenylyl-L-tyrosine phosphorylase n=1 Tax=Paludibacillus litoralis TaxID=3133267 RepID=UPI0030ECA845
MTTFADLVSAAPRAFDARRGAEAADRVGASGRLRELLIGAGGSSPFLAGLIAREAEWLPGALALEPKRAFDEILAGPTAADGLREASSALRLMKRRAALLIALADLGGVWDLAEVTRALSDLADHAVDLAFSSALAAETSGPLKGMTPQEAGLVVLAMGKGGARELNYSSDIDLILLHDGERHGAYGAQEVKPRWAGVARRAVKLLSEATGDGYVFRVDLRLRPNPSTTPICLSMNAAEGYYESVGRTWERAAFIKARPAAGDLAAGADFLERLAPFIWRRHLDFAALEDINEIRAKIRDAKGLRGLRDLPGYNLKLGPGGIREIEFFVQTQQLALGGRDPSLRARATMDALGALAAAGWIKASARDALADAYRAHRTLEHRLQMIEDAQTHDIPVSADARAQVAALGGWPDREAMEAEVSARLGAVRELVQGFFTRVAPGSGGNEPVEDVIARLPFARPEMVGDMVGRWAAGGVAATRGSRARRKFRALAPAILTRLAKAGDPDDAVLQFDRFMSGLPAGAQLFSLFEANPQLLDLLAEICAAAPRLSAYLGRNAQVLDAVLDSDFFAPLEGRGALAADLAAAISDADDYESTLDGVRVWAKEQRFRLGVQVLRGIADEVEAGRGFSNIAEVCLGALLPVVEAEFSRRHGPPPGRGAAVIAMGKFGGREMTASSDLDLIVVYDAEGEEQSAGPKPLTVSLYYARLTQKIVSALTAPTAEGALYEVDMRLRPSGGQGPVAVSLSGFQRYQMEEAWTWEHMALTRARPVAGLTALREELGAVIETVLSAPRDKEKTREDVAAMRARLADANRSVSGELWALKHGRGGLMDIEFAAQNALLGAGLTGAGAALAALEALQAAGALAPDDAEALIAAYRLQSRLQQVERVALTGSFRAETAGDGLKAAMVRAVDAMDFKDLESRLNVAREDAAAIVDRLLGG